MGCARKIEFFSNSRDTMIPSTRLMLECGVGRDPPSSHKVPPRKSPKEQISMVFHGYTITHMDSFAHSVYNGKLYNGVSADFVTPMEGAIKHSIEPLKNGIVSRGVLIDIPLLKETAWMKPGEGVTADDILSFEKKFGVTIEEGDIVLIRTGFMNKHYKEGPSHPEKDGAPSIHPNCLPLFYERKIATLGSDTCNDVFPALYPSFRNPVHVIALNSMGLWLIDNCDLEELAITCSKLARFYFMLTLAPLPMEGATGSPVNPIALF